jgi:hypothetical protein
MIEITQNKIDKVEIQYTVIEDNLTYMDILTFDAKEYEGLSEADIEKTITDKFTVWKDYINTPIPLPTKAQTQALLLKLQTDKTNLEKEIAVVSAKITK